MIRVAAGLIRRGDTVLFVKQQGDDHPEPNWALPGGVVEPGESLVAGLRREIREETGLSITEIYHLAWSLEVQGHDGGFYHAFVYEAATTGYDLQVNDPDGYVLDARFLPVSEAVQLVERTLPWRSMREPLLAYLRGLTPPGTNWFYRQLEGGDEILELAIPGIDPSITQVGFPTNGGSRSC